MNTLIIIPAYNEEKNIERVVNMLVENYPQYDYVVVNDCSKDDTKGVCERNKYNYIDLPINLGLAGAVQAGYKYAYKNNYDVAIQLDGDGQHHPKYIKKMITMLKKKDADMIIGSRFVKKTSYEQTFFRMLGNRVISFIINGVTSTGFLAVSELS